MGLLSSELGDGEGGNRTRERWAALLSVRCGVLFENFPSIAILKVGRVKPLASSQIPLSHPKRGKLPPNLKSLSDPRPRIPLPPKSSTTNPSSSHFISATIPLRPFRQLTDPSATIPLRPLSVAGDPRPSSRDPIHHHHRRAAHRHEIQSPATRWVVLLLLLLCWAVLLLREIQWQRAPAR
ncbi:uncharacterized protein A4U43_C07F33580 [Asparagus officinalis]|uniref:Uncharacterized protein n=1 Tax=Asparagus officinalis TaxID=4686 RepID=A0A5P1EGS3_ASPOF|nr:uncharacterized protein A4U43_C07F33580 [Asparagus officinalis]